MKNLKVSMKLIVGFLIAVILTAIVGVVGLYGLLTASSSTSRLYDVNVVPVPYLSKVTENIHEARVYVREYVISLDDGDTAGVETTKASIDDIRIEMTQNLDNFGSRIDDPDVQVNFDKLRALAEGTYFPYLDRTYQLAHSGDKDGVIAEIINTKPSISEMIGYSDKIMELVTEDARIANVSNDAMTTTLLIVIIFVIIVSVAISLLLAFYISRLISKPLGNMSEAFELIGAKGILNMPPEIAQSMQSSAVLKDEIGVASREFNGLLTRLTNVSQTLERLSEGDLTVEIDLLSDSDTMGISLMQMVESLNSMFAEINQATQQVSTGSKQVADGAQSLAQGSTQQAASIQELSSSIAEIAEKTKENAAKADTTSKLSETIKDNAEKGSRQMDEMIAAVRDINDASQSISKIIKTIDDIAFQTNILALNAAVEAARAGQHGKGFAVVAEEVRNLASKSAEAAKETGVMIQNSVDMAELGSRIAGETAGSLKEIVSGVNESTHLIMEIANASEQQSQGIMQVNIGIDQVAQVVQQNSATAEESAAASEEMSSQSSMLQQQIAQFKLKDSGAAYRSLPPIENPVQKRPAMSPSVGFTSVSSGDFGKY